MLVRGIFLKGEPSMPVHAYLSPAQLSIRRCKRELEYRHTHAGTHIHRPMYEPQEGKF